MIKWKQRLEQRFESLAETIYHRPKPFIVAVILLSLALASQIFFIQFDTSTEGFLSKDAPAVQRFDVARQEFGRGDFILLTIESDDVFQFDVIERLQKLHTQLEQELPWLDSVDSLINARNTRGTDDGLEVGELFDPYPETRQQLEQLRQRVLDNPLFIDLLVSADSRFTTIRIQPLTFQPRDLEQLDELSGDLSLDLTAPMDLLLEPEPLRDDFLTNRQVADIIDVVEQIVEQYQSDDFQVLMGGMPVVTDKLIDTMIWEMLTFMPLAVVTIVIFLAILFRRLPGVQFPMVTVVMALLSTAGLLCLMRYPVQLPMMIIPTFILTVTVGDAVHFLTIFFRHFDQGEEKLPALKYALGHTGLPMLLTSLTTAAGLLSFAGTPIVPLSRMGIFSAIGVMLAFVYTIMLVPALISKINIQRRPQNANGRSWMDSILEPCIQVSTHYPKTILILAIALFALSWHGIRQLEFSHNPLKWLPENMAARHAIEAIDQNMGGSIPVEIIIDSHQPNGLHNPELLKRLDQLVAWLEQYHTKEFAVAKVSGLTFVVKETHRALNADQDDFYRIPEQQSLVAQELFLFENAGPDELSSIVDSQFQRTRMMVIMPWIDTTAYKPLLNDLQSHFDQTLGELADTEITGAVPLLGSTLFGVIRTMAQSYAIALVVITLMMMLLLSSVRYGLLAMVPNILPISVMMGMMHWLNIPLDMFTMLVASISIGIAVDDTVHFMHHYHRYFEKTGSAVQAVTQTLQTSGRAMLTTSIVLCVGFSMLIWSQMHNITNFGLLTASTIFMALIADLILAPALMILIHHRRR